MPRGVQRSVRAANLEFYSDHGISFVKQGRTANRNYSQPYVRCSPFRRSCDTHTNASSTTARIPFLQIILPLSTIVSDGLHCVLEYNELFRPVSFHSRRLSLSLSLSPFLPPFVSLLPQLSLSWQVYIHRFTQSDMTN